MSRSWQLFNFFALPSVSITHETSLVKSSPDASEIHQKTVRSLGQHAHVYGPAIKEYGNCVIYETALGLDLDRSWPSSRENLNHVQ